MPGWLDQWNRVLRWYERFRLAYQGGNPAPSTDHFQDDAYAFFQNCYHLKDWLKNDLATKHLVSDVERYINESTPLSLCADMANGSKHMELDQRARVDRKTAITRADATVAIGTAVTVKYHIDAGGLTYDAFDIATKALDDWRQFLSSKNLL